MTKNFCDLCGEPAAKSLPDLKVSFPEMEWRGTKFEPGSIANVDGTWTPYVSARVIFEAHDMPRSGRTYLPDLCSNCVAQLLSRMSNSLVAPPIPTRTIT